jgi:hypothetical protein
LSTEKLVLREFKERHWKNLVTIVTKLHAVMGGGGGGGFLGRGREFLSPAKYMVQLRSPQISLYKGYCWTPLQDKVARMWTWTFTSLLLVPTLRMNRDMLSFLLVSLRHAREWI